MLLNQAETAGLVGLSFRNLTSAETSAHVHSGNVGSSGPIVFTLCHDKSRDQTSRSIRLRKR